MATFPDPAFREEHALLVATGGSGAGCALVGVAIAAGGIGVLAVGGGEITVLGFALLAIGTLISIGGGVKMMAASKLGQATVTLSGHPLMLGEQWTAEFSQQVKAPCVVNSVCIRLVCQEWVQYRQGTDTRTDTYEVFSDEVQLREFGNVGPQAPISGEFTFAIPEDAMHSFSASDNRILWRLDLHTDVEGWPDRKASIPLEVAPRYAEPKEMN